MKYLIIGLLVLASGMFYFMHQSNKASAERLKQAEITHQQKLEREKAEELNKEFGGTAIKQETVKDVVNAKLDERPEITPEQASELNRAISEWNDAATVASSTSRIALSQPVAKMQEIKRNLIGKKYQGCAEATRLLYVDAMNTNVDAYLEFMKGKEHELNAINLMLDYNKQLELAEKEKTSCLALSA